MDSETIWTSILIPILIGPLFLLLKMIYDRYINQLNEKKLLVFNEKKNELKIENNVIKLTKKNLVNKKKDIENIKKKKYLF